MSDPVYKFKFFNPYAGAEWIQNRHSSKLSPFGVQVADLLGFVFRGLYHLSEFSLTNAEWSNPERIEIGYPSSLSTFDNSHLTELVILAHDLAIRLEIRPWTPRSLRLLFHRREGREGTFDTRHPTIESAVEDLHSLTKEKWNE